MPTEKSADRIALYLPLITYALPSETDTFGQVI
jgi:hypothetical protein